MPNLRHLAVLAARRYGIDPQIFLRQIQQESGFNPRARSRAGALGIAQFMPATARGAGVNPLDPRSALFGAARMDAQNLRKYGNWRDVLSLYNSGRGWAQGQKIGETRNYVASILRGHGTGAVSQDLTMPAPTMSGPNLSSVKAQLAQSLIAANQATSRGQRADYAPVLESLTALHSAAEAPSSPPGTSITSLPGAPQAQGIAHFEGKPVAAWIAPILRRARAAGWRGTVESGYRSFADQSRIYASGVRPAAKPGTSNHEMTGFPGGAVDVTDAASLARILRRLGITALRWAGAKDPVHFSHPHAGHY